MKCVILEYQYFQDYCKRHADISNRTLLMEKAFPFDWHNIRNLELKIKILAAANEQQVDLDDIITSYVNDYTK